MNILRTLIFFTLVLCASAAPTAKEIHWDDVCRTIKNWKSVNPTGTAAWAVSGSMQPSIRVGDLLLAEAYVGQPLTDEIAVYDFSGKYPDVSHLVIKETKFNFLPMGINNPRPDGWQSKRRIKWVVVAILRPSYNPAP